MAPIEAFLALKSDSRGIRALNELAAGGSYNRPRDFEQWKQGDSPVVKITTGKIGRNRELVEDVKLLVTDDPEQALQKLGFKKEEVVLVMGEDTQARGEEKYSFKKKDIYLKPDSPLFDYWKEFPNVVALHFAQDESVDAFVNELAARCTRSHS